MTTIERVRSVLAAGTPGRWEPVGEDFGYSIAAMEPFKPLQAPDGSFEEADGERLILAVNLAPAFVALWSAAEAWEQQRMSIGAAYRPAKYQTEMHLLQALAALNEAAAREVGS